MRLLKKSLLQGRRENDPCEAYFRSTSKGSNDRERCRGAFSAASNRKSLRPPITVRDEGFMRFVVPPWFGNERRAVIHHPSLAPYEGDAESITRVSRIRLRGEFGDTQTGLHHPPALSNLCDSRTTPRRRLTIWFLSQADRTWEGVSSRPFLPPARTLARSVPSTHSLKTPQTASLPARPRSS
jgi:hypothetical protein